MDMDLPAGEAEDGGQGSPQGGDHRPACLSMHACHSAGVWSHWHRPQ
jgi:hypothetical protein